VKIAFLARSLDYGGAERQMVALAKGLQAAGHQIMVVSFYPGGAFADELLAAGAQVRSLEKRGRWDVFTFGVRLIRLLRLQAPEVLHAYLGVPNILAVLIRPFLRRQRIVWGLRASDMDWTHYDLVTRALHGIEPWLSAFADLVIVNSHAGYRYATKLSYTKHKLVVIPNGIDVKGFHPNPEAGEGVRREWGIETGQFVIGLVGRIDPMKDHRTFLEAAARIIQRRSDVRFVCVGSGAGAYKDEILAHARGLGLEEKLFWQPNRPDMKNVYNAFDILCSASISEGFPNVVAEAMACGVPCVVTDVGDSRQIVGDTGIVVDPRNPEALANGLERMIGNLESDTSLREAARARVVENFAVDRLVERTANALQALLCSR
jgi:glycosyltransferase involved in cell wall biosynthesis